MQAVVYLNVLFGFQIGRKNMESSGAKCPDMESLVEDTESRVDCVPLLATSLMDLSPER